MWLNTGAFEIMTCPLESGKGDSILQMLMSGGIATLITVRFFAASPMSPLTDVFSFFAAIERLINFMPVNQWPICFNFELVSDNVKGGRVIARLHDLVGGLFLLVTVIAWDTPN